MEIKFNCSNPQCRRRISVDESMAGHSLLCPACSVELLVPSSKNVKFTCSNPECGQHIEVDVSEAGRFLRCPACGKPLQVPGAPPKPIVPKQLLQTPKSKPDPTSPSGQILSTHRKSPFPKTWTPFKRLLCGWGIGAAICGLVIGDLQLRAWEDLPKHLNSMMNEIYFHGEILIAPVENHAGTSLLYVRTVEGGVGVFMVDLARLARTQIALGNAANWGRSRAVRLFGWSPDDHYLAFSTIRENDKDRHVTICDGATGKEITSFDAPDPLETGTWLNGHSLILFDDSHRLSLYNLEDSDKLGQYGAKGLVQFRQLDSTASSPVADSEKSVAYLEDGNLWDLLLHDNLTVQLTHLKNYAICAGVDYCAATDKYLFAVTNDSSIQPILCQYDPRGGKSSVTAIKGCANYQFDARWIQNGAGVAYVGIDGNRYCLGVKAEGLASHTNLFAASPYNPNHGFLNQTVFPEGDQVIRTISVNPGEDKIYTVASVNYEPLGIWECDLASQKIRNVVPVTEHLAYSHSITPIESSFTNQDGENVAYYYLPPAGLKPDRRYPALIDTYSDLGYQPDSQFLANAGVFYVTVNPYGKGFPKEPTTPEDIVGVYREILKNPNVDPYRIYIGGQSAGTATIATLLADHSVLWRGAIILSPDAFQEVSPDTEIVASIFFSYGEQDDEENRERMERYAQTACARDALVQILYVRAGHGVFDIDELKNQYRAIATFILENR